MGVELSSDADLARRVNLRSQLLSERRRLRCKRCSKAIPEERRIISLYCSEKCHNAYNWEQINELRTEMRGEARRLLAPTNCKCGAPLDNRPGRPGKVAHKCRKCSNRESSRKYLQRKKDALSRSQEDRP